MTAAPPETGRMLLCWESESSPYLNPAYTPSMASCSGVPWMCAASCRPSLQWHSTKVTPGELKHREEQFSAERTKDARQHIWHFISLEGIQEKTQFSGVCFRKKLWNFLAWKKMFNYNRMSRFHNVQLQCNWFMALKKSDLILYLTTRFYFGKSIGRLHFSKSLSLKLKLKALFLPQCADHLFKTLLNATGP